MRTQLLVHIMGWLYLGSAQLHKAGQVHVWFCAQGAWRNYEGGRQFYLERFLGGKLGHGWGAAGLACRMRSCCPVRGRIGGVRRARMTLRGGSADRLRARAALQGDSADTLTTKNAAG